MTPHDSRLKWMPGRVLQEAHSHRETIGITSARLCGMKSTLQPVEHLGRFERLQLVEDLWDEFATESGTEARQEVLDELELRANWRDTHPEQGKSLAQIAQSLGVRL